MEACDSDKIYDISIFDMHDSHDGTKRMRYRDMYHPTYKYVEGYPHKYAGLIDILKETDSEKFIGDGAPLPHCLYPFHKGSTDFIKVVTRAYSKPFSQFMYKVYSMHRPYFSLCMYIEQGNLTFTCSEVFSLSFTDVEGEIRRAVLPHNNLTVGFDKGGELRDSLGISVKRRWDKITIISSFLKKHGYDYGLSKVHLYGLTSMERTKYDYGY